MVYNEEELVSGAPLVINILADISDIKLVSPPTSSQAGTLVPIKVEQTQLSTSDNNYKHN